MESTAWPASTVSALGIQAEKSLNEFRGACPNLVSSSDSSPHSTSTSGAPARYALAAMCRTSGAASNDTPVASGPRMISR